MTALDIQGVKLLTQDDRICISVLGILDKAARGPLPFEPESLPVWQELCSSPGSHVLDIGAYSGLYSLIAKKAGAEVIAFEPLERNRLRFRDNMRLNGFDLEARPEAVSDQVGFLSISTNLRVTGLSSGSSIVKKVGKDDVRVPTLTIDSLNLEKVTAIKVDVERAEPLVILGALQTLKRCRPILLLEVLGDEEATAVNAALEGTGYWLDQKFDKRNWLLRPPGTRTDAVG